MYLKSIEIIGFKSFANKTIIELKPGITAIVGPNGCGKSNVSDAVRWVLGEQKAKSLRGSSMQDIIFNGTDETKPMGMAEVSLTLADCNNVLNTEYNEVCITRRVYRSNESGYFINKKACRLKDIQRLFMDTGIGTDSYSVLEQGKIDQILSARAEDRRTVFEEASGITKFKTDKKESLRKLEQTEANLIRLEDVIKEVKRQIISLQRQAGKAKRYKELKEEIRSLDLYISSKQLNSYKENIDNLINKLKINEEDLSKIQQQINDEEEKSKAARSGLTEVDTNINQILEKISSTKSDLENSKRLIILNKERIEELNEIEKKNNNETIKAKEKLKENRIKLNELKENDHLLNDAVEKSKKDLDDSLDNQKNIEINVNKIRDNLKNLRSDSISSESKITTLQNKLNSIESSDRENILKRERLITESKETQKNIENFNSKEIKITNEIKDLSKKLISKEDEFTKLSKNKALLDEEFRSRELDKILNDFKNNLIDIKQIIALIENLFKINRDEKNQISILLEELETIKHKKAIHEGELQITREEIKNLKKRFDTIDYELNEIQKNSSEGIEYKSTLALQIDEEKNNRSKLQESIKTSNDELTDAEIERSRFYELNSEKRIIYNEKVQNRNQHEMNKQPLIIRINELEELINDKTVNLDEFDGKRKKLNNEIHIAEQNIQPFTTLLKESDEKIINLREKRSEYLSTVSGSDELLKELRSKNESVFNTKSQHNISKVEETMKADNLLNRIIENYSVTKEQAYHIAIPNDWNEDNHPSDDEIESRIVEIRTKIDSMGIVNLIAIDEHKDLEERYSFLLKEQTDLLNSKKQLLEMISKINETTTDLFNHTFNSVNSEFQSMFKKLFGGGSAKLVLTDEDDVLESGIEIIARPPGKKLQSISLLSGGERTMTAVALLFSLFKVKPSPFCVLDELDAALDDSNISRFVETLKSFVSESQFVIITHNRQTIAQAAVIYGVTMENRGISKIVSMQFSDYENKNDKKELVK